MTAVAYYLPGIPPNRSVTRYNHALAVAEEADRSLLITYPDEPPVEITSKYDRVIILQPKGVFGRAKAASKNAEEFLSSGGQERPIFLTTFHYAPAIAGWLSNHFWVLDVYDDPHQTRYHNPWTIHEVGARSLEYILRIADRGVHTVHASTQHTYGKDRYFAMNGANCDEIQPRSDDNSNIQVRGVCAGVHGGMEILIRALANVEIPIQVDIYGDISDAERKLSNNFGVSNLLTFHGECNHSEVVAAVEKADVGFCLLPKKTDWYYAHPIKIGEYLAAGTIPIASAFPGIRQLTRDSGMLVEYDSDAVAETLTKLDERPGLRDRLQARCRQRAESIDWREEREWFAKQALYGDDAAVH